MATDRPDPSSTTPNGVHGMPKRAHANSHVRASILHISDLHFGRSMVTLQRQINPELLQQLKHLVKDPEVSPDYIVVSGDVAENPSPLGISEAYRFICELAEEALVPPDHVLVIPGNHDYKMAGNVGLSYTSRVPFEAYFRGDWANRGSWEQRKNWIKQHRSERWGAMAKLTLGAMFGLGKRLGDSVVTIEDVDRGIVIFGIQSTPTFEGFATGRVNSEQLSELTNLLETKKEEWSQAFKIAVVHHHPLPMSYDSVALRGRAEESLMVFYNAGGFLRELTRHGVDLVLHGHKHVAGFRRAVYDYEDGTRRSVGVMAAGSATHKSPNDPLGNEFNLIKINEDETVTIDRWYFSPDVRQKDESAKYYLYNVADVRDLRTKRHHQHFGLRIGKLRKEVTITRHGYSQMEFYVEDCKVCDKQTLESYALPDLVVERPCYLRGLTTTRYGRPVFDPRIVPEPGAHPWNIRAKLDFGRPKSWESDSFDLIYKCRLMNGHALSHKEFQRRYKSRKYEGEELTWDFSSIKCDKACDILKLKVTFPEDFDMKTIAAYDAVAYYFPRTTNLATNKRLHGEETRRIKSKLTVTGQTLSLEVPQPMPEFIYRIRWHYKPESVIEGGPVLTEQERRDVREQLVEMATATAPTPEMLKLYDSVRDPLLTFTRVVRGRYADHTLDVSLAVFDDRESVLRFVIATFGKVPKLSEETLMTGEGCAGLCFEQANIVFYSDARDKIGYYLDPDEIANATGKPSTLTKAQALISIPWVVPGLDMPMGVVTISSEQRASRLLGILDQKDQLRREEVDVLRGLTEALSTIILALLTGRRLVKGGKP